MVVILPSFSALIVNILVLIINLLSVPVARTYPIKLATGRGMPKPLLGLKPQEICYKLKRD